MNLSRTGAIAAFAGGSDNDISGRLVDESGGSAPEYGDGGENRHEQAPRPLTIAAACVAAGALIAGALSVGLPWLRVGAGGSVHFYAGTSLTVIPIAMIALPIVALLATAVCLVRRSQDAQDVAILAAAATVSLAGVLLLFVECASAVIPTGLLPATIRRYTLDLQAGPGLWLALAGSAIALAALAGRLQGSFGHPLAGRGVRFSAPRVATLAGLATLAVGFGFLRYGSWVQASAVGQSYGIGGWALPWVGPLSLVAMLGLIAGAGATLAGREVAAALLAAASGWLITLAAALTIITSDTLASVRFADFAPASLRGYTPHLGPGRAAEIGFALGLAAAGIGAAVLGTAGRASA